MFRKLSSLLISFALLTFLVLPVCAQAGFYITDEAGVLLPEEITSLEQKAAALEARYGIHAVILTVDSLNGSRAQEYADDYYDNADYGDDGILFLLAMAEREWYISTCGTLVYALTDYGIQQVGEHVVSYLGEGLWFDGFCAFLDMLPVLLDAYENGNPIDGFVENSGDNYHGAQEEIVHYEEKNSPNFLLSLLCGMIVSGVVVLIMRLSMNSKKPQRTASAYMEDGSWNLTQRQDIFLYSNVTKTRKADPPKSSGGGSSVHRSSGGRSHGGGGGRF